MKTKILAVLLGAFGLSGCASTSRIQVSVSAPQPDVYKATIRTLVTNGFQVVHSDRDSAIIAGERPIKNIGTNREAGRMIKVTILAEGKNQITELFVTWTPPEWAFGSFKPEHDEFIRGLSHALPNIKIVSNY